MAPSVVIRALFFFALLFVGGAADSYLPGPQYIDQLTYNVVYPAYPCVLLVGADGPIGCSTGGHAAVGFLRSISTPSEFEQYTSKKPDGPDVVVLAAPLFTSVRAMELGSLDGVKGILVLPSTDGLPPLPAFSAARKHPNVHFGLYPDSTRTWNPVGDGFGLMRIPVPIFQLSAESASGILQHARENEQDRRWGATLSAWMYPSDDSTPEECLRRGTCAPLGGKSVVAALSEISSSTDTVLVTATTDAFAFFHDLAIGASSYQSGVVAVMAAAKALRAVDRSELKKQIMFAFFNGESWGYLGSKRFVYDIAGNFTCEDEASGHCSYPYRSSKLYSMMSIEQISDIIDVSQLGNAELNEDTEQYSFFLHDDVVGSDVSSIEQAFDIAASGVPRTQISVDTPWEELPPSPLQTFLRSNRSIRGVVLADHSTAFRNHYFGSQYDDINNVNLDAVCRASTMLARAVYGVALGKDDLEPADIPPSLKADCDDIEELYNCFAGAIVCNATKRFYEFSDGVIPPPSHYTGVYSRHHGSLSTQFLRDWMANETMEERSDVPCKSNSDCPSHVPDCVLGHCGRGGWSYYYEAVSPAFDIWTNEFTSSTEYAILDKSEPLWTEAYWKSPYVEVHEMINPISDYIVLAAGCGVLLLTLLVLFAAQKLFSWK